MFNSTFAFRSANTNRYFDCTLHSLSPKIRWQIRLGQDLVWPSSIRSKFVDFLYPASEQIGWNELVFDVISRRTSHEGWTVAASEILLR